MRGVFAEIDLEKIRHNALEVKKLCKDQKILGIVKASAYGHGAIEVARNIEEIVDGFGVALSKEGISLREGGVRKPILVLGYTDVEDYSSLIEYDLTQTVFTLNQCIDLNKIGEFFNQKVKIHIKIETGMNRLGFQMDEETIKGIISLKDLEFLDILGIFSHMANGGEEDLSYSKKQLEKFLEYSQIIEEGLGKKLIKHISNSATLVEMPEARLDMVRPGLMLYGCKPTNHKNMELVHLEKPLKVKGRIVQIKDLKKGEKVSYTGSFTSKEDMKIGICPIGYEDGIFRSLSNKGFVEIKGERCPIVGNVCMDYLMVDVTHVLGVKELDYFTFYGDEAPVEELAALGGTISYELLCALSLRVPRKYYNRGHYEIK